MASVRIFGRPIAALALSSNWGKLFNSAEAAPGRAAWRHGHVFVIDHQDSDGSWVMYDGNSGGGMIRMHKRSLAGFRIVDPQSPKRHFASI